MEECYFSIFTLLHWIFLPFLNCTNSTKLCNKPHMSSNNKNEKQKGGQRQDNKQNTF